MGWTRRRSARERRLTRGRMDVLRKADDGLSNGILFSSRVEVAMQQVVLCLNWCASMGQPKSTTSYARTGQVMSSTGKRSAGKLARCVWTGGKSVSSYLSVLNTFPRTGLASLSSRPVRALHQFHSFRQSSSISKGRSCLVLTLAFVRAVFLIAPRQLVRVGELSWQPDVQMGSEEVWVQFALSG